MTLSRYRLSVICQSSIGSTADTTASPRLAFGSSSTTFDINGCSAARVLLFATSTITAISNAERSCWYWSLRSTVNKSPSATASGRGRTADYGTRFVDSLNSYPTKLELSTLL